ncbi:unnamed protein product [Somion occarium]|uniref:Protein BIG1 n=1 Tax=Somion occarium TaxID=3059160 RepID=A0ABP1D8H9_9APHY
MLVNVLWLAATLSTVFAYSNTHPIIAWSSHRAPSLEATSSSDVLERILLSDDICNHDAVVLFDHPGLHASDLRLLSPNSAITTTLNAAPSSLQLPYVVSNLGNPFPDLAEVISKRCGSKLVHTNLGGLSEGVAQNGEKHVICVSMPPISDGDFGRRKHLMSEYESQLSSDLEALSFISPHHLVVYAGRPHFSTFRARQDPSDPQAPPHNGTAFPDGGVLKRYQLLTPGLILSLLVAFFVLVPVILGGIHALASIKNPIRVDNTKFSAVEKKNQ